MIGKWNSSNSYQREAAAWAFAAPFGVQSFTDELAGAAGRDRVEYLLELIGQPRIAAF